MGERVQVRVGGAWFFGRVVAVSTRGARVRLDSNCVVYLKIGGKRVWRYPEQRESGSWPAVIQITGQ